MSHHGREGEREYTDADYERFQAKLWSAVELISDVAAGRGYAPARCDKWLEENGYACEETRRADRERRADEQDREIARLRAEIARLRAERDGL